MYMTRIKLDMYKSDTIRAINCPEIFHGAIENAFSDGNTSRKLWKIDESRAGKYLLILSRDVPETEHLIEQFGDINLPAETKCYDGLLNAIEEGSVWQFRLAANPTYCKSNPAGRGSVSAHVTAAQQVEWLIRKGNGCGFEIVGDTARVIGKKWHDFHKGNPKNHVRILAVEYDGLLRVTDAALFKNAMTNGIGRGKAYGVGLMMVKKAM